MRIFLNIVGIHWPLVKSSASKTLSPLTTSCPKNRLSSKTRSKSRWKSRQKSKSKTTLLKEKKNRTNLLITQKVKQNQLKAKQNNRTLLLLLINPNKRLNKNKLLSRKKAMMWKSYKKPLQKRRKSLKKQPKVSKLTSLNKN